MMPQNQLMPITKDMNFEYFFTQVLFQYKKRILHNLVWCDSPACPVSNILIKNDDHIIFTQATSSAVS